MFLQLYNFIIFVNKMREAFALPKVQKLLTFFFNKKYWCISDINNRNFNETLTNDVVSFTQPGPDLLYRTISGTIYISNLRLFENDDRQCGN